MCQVTTCLWLLGNGVESHLGAPHVRLIGHLILTKSHVVVLLGLEDPAQFSAPLLKFNLSVVDFSLLLQQLLLLLPDPVLDSRNSFLLALAKHNICRLYVVRLFL